ncbi:MAG: ABC transporter ATP-binding protein [Carbonactinosporaceae bacterium]
MTRIDIQRLNKSHVRRGGGLLPVLEDLTLDVADGEFVCLVGPSGCGKSTTLDILAGLTQPDSGDVLVDGQPGTKGALFGYVFQHPRLLNWRTVTQNIEFGLAAQGVPKQEWQTRIHRYLEMVRLTDFADAYPLTLSGGMQQRTAIARALAIDPDVLLMDEPFSSLDELTARRLRVELIAIWEQAKKTVVFVTHNALEAAYLADRIYVVSARPARLVATLPVQVPRPRRPDDPELIRLQQQVVQVLEETAEEDPDGLVLGGGGTAGGGTASGRAISDIAVAGGQT